MTIKIILMFLVGLNHDSHRSYFPLTEKLYIKKFIDGHGRKKSKKIDNQSECLSVKEVIFQLATNTIY